MSEFILFSVIALLFIVLYLVYEKRRSEANRQWENTYYAPYYYNHYDYDYYPEANRQLDHESKPIIQNITNYI